MHAGNFTHALTTSFLIVFTCDIFKCTLKYIGIFLNFLFPGTKGNMN